MKHIFCLSFLFLAWVYNVVGQDIQAVKNPDLPYQYLVFFPDDYSKNPQKRYPLLLSLHGRSLQGRDLEKVKSYGVIYEILRGLKIDFVVVAPQCQSGWDNEKLIKILDYAEKSYRIDLKKVYLTGMSMGGYGAWHLAGAYPQRFAAASPIAGGGKLSDAPNMKDLPLWVFHGAKDVPVPVEESRKMVKAVRDAGNKRVEYSEYKNWGHSEAVHVYAMPELYNWFLKYERNNIINTPIDSTPNIIIADIEPIAEEDNTLAQNNKPGPNKNDNKGELPYLEFEDCPSIPQEKVEQPTVKPNPNPKKKNKWWQFWRWPIWRKTK